MSSPRRRRAFALLALMSLVAGCALPVGSSQEALDTPADPGNWDDPWGDGLNRVVVLWTADGQPPAGEEISALRSQDFEPVDPNHPLAGNGGSTGDGSSPGASDDSPAPTPPTTVPPTTTTQAPTTTTIPPVDGHPLLGEPGVVEVNEVGEDLYQVVTELDEERVADLPGVVQAWDEPVASTSADPQEGNQWYLQNDGSSRAGGQAGADAGVVPAWDRSTGSGIVVAVIDTGVQVDHPDLAGRIWNNTDEQCGNGVDDDNNGYVDDCQGWDFTDDDGVVVDTNGHGTHIAGTIAAEIGNGEGISGVAPNAQIMPVRISTGARFGLSVTVRAIDYAVNNGADILNLSWGTAPGVPVNAYPPLSDAIERARRAGVLVMIAAGNSGANIDDRPVIPASYPHDNVITVGASTSSDTAAWFSNYGVRTVEVFAPGHNIFATVPGSGYGWKSGTSMAAPVTAGVAALLWAADPSADYTAVRDALFDGVTTIGSMGTLASAGGRVDAADSLGLLAPGVKYEVGGLFDLAPGSQTVTVRTVVDDVDELGPVGDLSLRTTLMAIHDDQLYSLTDQSVVLNGEAATSDDAGQLLTAPSGSVPESTLLGLDLPAGEYGLLLELVSVDSGTAAPVGPGGVVGFRVTDNTVPTTQPVDPGAPTTTVATPVDPGTPAPPTTTSTPPGDNPGDAPAPTTTPTTVPGDNPGDAPAPTTTPTTVPGDNPGTPAPTTTPTTVPGDAPAPTTTEADSGNGRPGNGNPNPAPPDSTPGNPNPGPPDSTPGNPNPGPPDSTPGNPNPGGGTPTTVPAGGGVPPTTVPAGGGVPPTTVPAGGGVPPTTAAPPQNIGDLVLTGLNPRSGPTTGGEVVTITGVDLGDRASVSFGDRGAQVMASIAGAQLIVITPPGSLGTVDVTVSSNGRTGTLVSAYTYTDGSTPVPTTSPTAPTTSAPGGDNPGTTAPGNNNPDTTPTTAPGNNNPGTTPTTAPGNNNPGTTPTTAPGDGNPGTTTPGAAPTTSTPAGGAPTTTSPGGDNPGTTTPGNVPTSDPVAPPSTTEPGRIETPDGLKLRPIGDTIGGRGITAGLLRNSMCGSPSCAATTA